MKKFRYVLFTALMMVLFLAGCGKKKPTVVDPTDYVSLTFSGYDGYGTFVSKDFDASGMRSAYEDALGDVTKSKLTKLFGNAKVTLTKDTKYANGDSVSVEWDVDEDDLAEFEKEYNVSVTLKDFEYTVTGLTAVTKFDPFEDLVVTPSGISGRATLTLQNSAYPNLRFYFVDADGDRVTSYEKAANGDKIKIVLYSNGNDVTALCLDTLGKAPTRTEIEYTVSGLDSYVADISEVTAALEDQIKAEVLTKLNEQAANWNIPSSLCEITYMGAGLKYYTGTSTYYSINYNEYVVLFKVDVDSPRDGAFSYYFTGTATNLLKSGSGEITYKAFSVPEIKVGRWSTSGTGFKHNNLWYSGYETFDIMYEEVFTKATEYQSSDKFDKTIIEKQTHTPKDFSVIDATITLESADVCFGRNDGYNTIIGFSQSGYDKIMAYTASQHIKLLLPSKDSEGSDVDDVHFYSNAVDSTQGFSFNTLIETNTCPRIYIVLPETCARFSGFRDSSINEDGLYKVTGIDFNENLTLLGDYALDSIHGIKKLTIPANVTIIPYRCFHEMKGLESVTFLGSPVKFASYCFQNCDKLVIDELVLNNQVIESNAFEKVTINKLVLSSDYYHADYDYGRDEWEGANVVSFIINPGVTVINSYAFYYLSTVKEIVFPDSLVEIKYSAFKNCTALEKVTFPAKLPKFGENAFFNCKSLVIDSLTLTEDLDLSEECFSGVTINTVTYASDNFATKKKWWAKNCLYGCNVKNFVIADTVTKIPSYLFSGMKYANSIEIPSNVTTIEENAFYNYNDLIKVICGASVTTIDDYLSLNSNVTVYAPKGSAMITYCINKGIRYVETE